MNAVMKNGIVYGLIVAGIVSAWFLIFRQAEEEPAPAVRVRPVVPRKYEESARPMEDADQPREISRSNSPRPALRAASPGQDPKEKARREKIAAERAVFEAAVAAHDANAIVSRDFLIANGKRRGVVTTDSGLQYEVITPGTGALPAATDMVTVHYHGTLPDGTVFDSSIDRGETISFPLSGVIAGWTEGMQLLPAGSRARLFIPSYLAYGEQGGASHIPAHTALVFEIELMGINQK
jgi:FKBP-type peptidyl-prolyl cis-trans isomerase